VTPKQPLPVPNAEGGERPKPGTFSGVSPEQAPIPSAQPGIRIEGEASPKTPPASTGNASSPTPPRVDADKHAGVDSQAKDSSDRPHGPANNTPHVVLGRTQDRAENPGTPVPTNASTTATTPRATTPSTERATVSMASSESGPSTISVPKAPRESDSTRPTQSVRPVEGGRGGEEISKGKPGLVEAAPSETTSLRREPAADPTSIRTGKLAPRDETPQRPLHEKPVAAEGRTETASSAGASPSPARTTLNSSSRAESTPGALPATKSLDARGLQEEAPRRMDNWARDRAAAIEPPRKTTASDPIVARTADLRGTPRSMESAEPAGTSSKRVEPEVRREGTRRAVNAEGRETRPSAPGVTSPGFKNRPDAGWWSSSMQAAVIGRSEATLGAVGTSSTTDGSSRVEGQGASVGPKASGPVNLPGNALKTGELRGSAEADPTIKATWASASVMAERPETNVSSVLRPGDAIVATAGTLEATGTSGSGKEAGDTGRESRQDAKSNEESGESSPAGNPVSNPSGGAASRSVGSSVPVESPKNLDEMGKNLGNATRVEGGIPSVVGSAADGTVAADLNSGMRRAGK